MSIENRRKQLAQCIWLRQRVDTHLTAGDDLIVLGDFNDGPGLDEYEKLFGRSGIEIVLDEDHASACLTRTPTSHLVSGSAQCRPHRASNDATVRTCKRCLITSWSPRLRDLGPDWQIWHPFDHPDCYENRPLCEALLTASDHFPVVMKLPI
tara:strand:+ start:627 stop:1082 length:456 start_codon:yes stop_codon:yes gene_type:complete